MLDHDHCGADAAAYAIGALEPAEAEAFRRHLETCSVCQEEIKTFTAVVGVLPMATEQYQAPSGLRRRVVREITAAPSPARPRVARLSFTRPALAGLCAAMSLAVVAFGGVELAGLTGTARTHVYAASVGDAVVRVSGDRAELVVKHLPQPGAGKIYEVWLKRGSRPPQPARVLFGVDHTGRGDVVVPGSVRGVSTVMVTAEPAGGTSTPTSAPVIIASL